MNKMFIALVCVGSYLCSAQVFSTASMCFTSSNNNYATSATINCGGDGTYTCSGSNNCSATCDTNDDLVEAQWSRPDGQVYQNSYETPGASGWTVQTLGINAYDASCSVTY
jgi:hypothetical protein